MLEERKREREMEVINTCWKKKKLSRTCCVLATVRELFMSWMLPGSSSL